MSRREPIIGIVILAAGLFILLGKLGFFAFLGGTLWPLLMVLAGGLLVYLVRERIVPAIIFVPGGMLLVYGVLFMICHWISWSLFSYLWPFLLLGLAFGLLGYCRLDPYAPRGAWLGAISLSGIGVLMLLLTILTGIGIYVIAIGLILLGVVFIFGGRFGIWRR